IERAAILRKRYDIHISGHNVPAPLESFEELVSRCMTVIHIWLGTCQNLGFKNLHLSRGRPFLFSFQAGSALLVHQQALARHWHSCSRCL
uniref:Uncharacterized protein n=1 Tax=Aegilops tauschii subsp. strangulata TaxID=200361 RepID=A0A453AW03_AEGTS